MDQGTSINSGEMLDHVDKGVKQNFNHLVEGVGTDAGAGHGLCGSVSVCGENGTSLEMCNDKELKEGTEEVMGDPPQSNDTSQGLDQGTSNSSSNSINGEVLETRVVIDSSSRNECINGDNRKLESKAIESGLKKLSIKAQKGLSEMDKNSCVIDMNRSGYNGFCENFEGEMICRICHLSSGQPLEATAVGTPRSANNTSTDLIMLGCACKDELGIAHSHCAEAWFKIKGNRLCEICGETAKNVSDVIGNGFIEEWIESRYIDNGRTSSRRLVGCCRGQPFCNFLMACLVIAFVLPWFFRVNMF